MNLRLSEGHQDASYSPAVTVIISLIIQVILFLAEISTYRVMSERIFQSYSGGEKSYV